MPRKNPVDFPALGFAGDVRRPAAMRSSHQHPEIEMNYLVDGHITYLVKGSLVDVPARRFAFFWASTPHRVIRTNNCSRFYWFTIPLAWIFQWNLPRKFMEQLLDGYILIDPPGDEDEVRCQRWCQDLHSPRPIDQEAAQLEIRARFLRATFQGRRAPSPAAPAGTQGRAQKIARFIAEHYLEEVTAHDIGVAAGLNSTYASTLFRRYCGMSPSAYLMQHRAYHAYRLLATTDQKIVTVAFESGFCSLSRFYASFQKVFRFAPRHVRQQMEASDR